ncbi:hypothetical protein V7793_35360, partial [Streptomyces sp. KLMMK]|uniref:hypothetical protein n=1 Tax=Streptomyces sp. KLMMK TaxID=3109353 RepID=UPI003008BE1F
MTTLDFPPDPKFISHITLDPTYVMSTGPHGQANRKGGEYKETRPRGIIKITQQFAEAKLPTGKAAELIASLVKEKVTECRPVSDFNEYAQCIECLYASGRDCNKYGDDCRHYLNEYVKWGFVSALAEAEPVMLSTNRIENGSSQQSAMQNYSVMTTLNDSVTDSVSQTHSYDVNVSISIGGMAVTGGGGGHVSYTTDHSETVSVGHSYTDSKMWSTSPRY